VLGIAFFTAWIFHDRLVERFVRQANTYLATPVKAGEIELSLFRDFPRLTISLRDVYVEDSHPAEFPLLSLKRLTFSFDPFDAWNGQYEVLAMEAVNGSAHLRYDKAGKDNFSIFRDTTLNGTDQLEFDIRDLQLRDVNVTYIDEQAGHHHEFGSPELGVSVSLRDGGYQIVTTGTVDIGQIGIGSRLFLKGKSFKSGLKMKFDPGARSVDIMPSELKLGDAVFQAEGYYDFQETHRMDLSLKGQNTTISTILSFLPSDIAADYARYQSEGDVYFTLQLIGSPDEAPGLAFSVAFGARNAVLFHPETGFRVTAANVKGKFSVIGDGANEASELVLEDASGDLNGKPFKGDFRLRNLESPWISLHYAGELEAPTLDKLLPDSLFSGIGGSLVADVSLKGRLSDLKSRQTAGKVASSGTIRLRDFTFELGPSKIPFGGWSGVLKFNGNDLDLEKVKGQYGRSDLALNGHVRNLLAYVLQDGQKIGMEASLVSDVLDLDQMLELAFGTQNNQRYAFSISPLVNLRIAYDIEALKYRRFQAKGLSGKLNVSGRQAILEKSRFKAMGGSVNLNGKLDGRDAAFVDITADLETRDVRLDSLFYVFENFNQQFITDRHLRGLFTSNSRIEARLTRNLELVPDRLIADLNFLIRKGELNDFEPILKLNKYLDDSGLRHLRFADLKNDIHIQDKTVFIPRMDIKSNLTTIQLSGKHTFDQHIDYHIVAPITGKRNINRAEAGTAFVEEKGGQSRLYLKITGTTDNYQVGYDMAAVKAKISGQIKAEIKSLKESFKAKPKEPKKKLELSEDEFFEWDN